ncbi:serine hydrolase domain-containing protein [Bacillus salitolerans]|uniref:Serine hydrolase domain-containing protein n=1 Tax=Bacillus salitolerans TaxID=1437434 RepID=A0ABW4LJQ8_9BACI
MKPRVLEFLNKEVEHKHIPGAVIHVSYKREVIMHEAIGKRVVYPKSEAMKLDTIFDLASLTKVVATLPAILKLIDGGFMSLHDPISNFIPEFSRNGKDRVTVKHLLTHTSGLPSHKQYYIEGLNKEQIYERIYQQELEVPMGKKVIYSDLGLIVLYNLIERITGETFERFSKREIFDPLDMTETCFNPRFAKDRFAATEYSEKLTDYKHGIVHDENTESMGGISGHAGLFSSVRDIANFAEMVENNGIFRGRRILSGPSLEIARLNYTEFDVEGRGLGWQLKGKGRAACGDLFSEDSYGHTGFTGTSIWFDPTVKLHVILLTNRVHFGRNEEILRIRPRLHNLIRASL